MESPKIFEDILELQKVGYCGNNGAAGGLRSLDLEISHLS
jgi:hypothetical protein